MRFGYLRNPLFLFCVALYFVNRFVFKAIWKSGFVHEHLNDLICIPFWVPIMLFAQRRCGLRDHDGRPEPAEIIIPLVIWSWVFEIVLPATHWLGDLCVADYWDVFTLGALIAAVIWAAWYPQREAKPVSGGANST
jgi:hypothetical protein